MRIVMMGTGPFAVPTLQALYASPHELLCLFTRPARPVHGRTLSEAQPMRALAQVHGTRVHDPLSINTPDSRCLLASYRPDVLVVCDFGQILKPEVLEIARDGGLNLHASLLPRYRGAAPIHWAIYHGERETGNTVIHMSPLVDAGPAIARVVTPIGPDETAAELEPRLAELGAPLVLEALAAIESGATHPIAQDPAQATRAPRLTKELGRVDWSRTAREIRNQVRALQPWPKTYSFLQRTSGEPLRLILDRVQVEPESGPAEPGTVVEAGGERLVVATGAGGLRIEAVQPAGKRVLSAGEFLRGYPLRVGHRLG
jgi:methionyl-tRNA formyltransferase